MPGRTTRTRTFGSSLVALAILVASPCFSQEPERARERTQENERAQEEERAPRPNVVLILADDLGIGDPRCYNPASKIPTPSLDRIAREGMRFTDAHSPSAVCTPTRYGILTGRYCWRTGMRRGVLWGDSPLLVDPARPTIASFLSRAGYATACIGKWHLGLGDPPGPDFTKRISPGPNDLGFDRFFGIAASLDQTPYVFIENDRASPPPSEWTPESRLRRLGGEGFWRAGPIAPGFEHEACLPALRDRALGFLREHLDASPERPFFLYFALTAPHTPWVPTKEYRGKSSAGWYGDFVVQIDATVGAVIEELEKRGELDDTLFLATSDNGSHWMPGDIAQFEHRANLDYRGMKADIHEGGHRVPLLARWPGRVPAGRVEAGLLCLTDLFATLASILGLELPEGSAEDSFDQSPALLGRAKKPIRDTIVHQSFHGMFAIREGDWKLVFGRGSGGFTDPAVIEPGPGEPPGQLYHLAEDPRERRNRFDDKPEIVQRLTDRFKRMIESGTSRPKSD